MKNPKYYFSNTSSRPFLEVEYVWDALKHLPLFFKTLELGKIEVKLPNGVFLENAESISIGEGTIVEPGSYIKGPAFIGKRCEIRQGAYLRGNVFLEDGSIVGHCTEVKNSIFLKGAHAAHFNYVGDSILGENSNLGAGVKCANFRLDQAEIGVWIEEKKIMTDLRKLGVILGDRSQIGCNSVTSPGTLIGQDVVCYPCMHIQGSVASGSLRKLKQELERVVL
jgi:UDP-N-acetylglucosamine diphosphorylase / glucose-1-phosphate thymidylyltransferase / UDP-N-acetylgalactosamine diphosphorylase / glucosamine-1-phosphate N-acetyltransferase / galactosamine-1-phosphate N-acetyltransferase